MYHASPNNKFSIGYERIAWYSIAGALLLLLVTIYIQRMFYDIPASWYPFYMLFTPIFVAGALLAEIVFKSFGWFLAIYGLSLVLGLALLLRSAPNRSVRFFASTVFAFLILSPLAVLQIYGPFTLATQLRQGYEISWLTEPNNRLASAIKSAQNEYEITGCRYTLYGWSTDNRLYYGSNCTNDLWQYDPAAGTPEPQRITSLPQGFEPSTRITKWGKSTGPQPPLGIESFTITFEKIASFDRTMEAAVIQKTFYGPLDVIVVHRPDAQTPMNK